MALKSDEVPTISMSQKFVCYTGTKNQNFNRLLVSEVEILFLSAHYALILLSLTF